jgi:hypothetical protein
MMDRIYTWGKSSYSKMIKIIVNILIMLATAGMGVVSGVLIVKKIDYAPYEYKIMGQWMKKNIPGIEHKSVMSRKFGVPFYAGAREIALFYGDFSEVLAYARSEKADYLIIDEWTIPKLRPELAFLIDEKEKHHQIQLIHTIKYKNRKIILYEFKERKSL